MRINAVSEAGDSASVAHLPDLSLGFEIGESEYEFLPMQQAYTKRESVIVSRYAYQE